MSRYAWLVCEETKEMVWLGKIVSDPRTSEVYFQVDGQLPNSSSKLMNQVIWRFLAQHIDKPLRVWSEETMDRSIDDSYVEIGNEDGGEVSADDYVRGFKG
jgi:hypothetical protein